MARYVIGILLFGFLYACSPISTTSQAKDFDTLENLEDSVFLVAGGGYNPFGAQVVLETNMKLFDKLADKYNAHNVTRLFGGGNNKIIKDILTKDPNFPVDDKLFSFLFKGSDRADCTLRHNNLSNLDGNSRKETVMTWMDVAAEELEDDDRFRFYYTGHGAHKPDRFDINYLALWQSEYSVQEFTDQLDKISEKTPTQVVMVQCFSGGFSQMNYVGGDIDKKQLSKANRCGFFSQVADRPAAGCSEDINDREEYSPYFFAAYDGVDEKGNKVDADFNKDGNITSDEAHAYVIMKEQSYDIPITTSSQLLRDQDRKIKARQRLASWDSLTADLNDSEKNIISSLSEELKYDLSKEDHPLDFIKQQIRSFERKIKEAEEVLVASDSLFKSNMNEIKNSVEEVMPIFLNQYSANYADDFILGTSEMKEARQAMLDHPQFANYKETYENALVSEKQFDAITRTKVKWERLEYLLETKLMEAILFESADTEVQDRYRELKACEAQSFF